jgi:hypothetical protein
MFESYQSLFNKSFFNKSARRDQSASRQQGCKPGLEQLEDRLVPTVSVPNFQEVIIDPNPSKDGSDVLEKSLADLNGDGKLDAIVGEGQVNGSAGGMFWYQNPGTPNGTWTRNTIDPSGNFYERSVTTDLNGDGATDIIASDSNQLVWFQNPGHGVGTWTEHVINSVAGAHDIVLGDLNGDGKLDVIASGTAAFDDQGYIAFQGNNPDQWTIVKFGNPGDAIALFDDGSGHGAVDVVGVDQTTGNLVYWQNPIEFGGNPLDGSQWTEHVIQANVPAGPGASIATGYLTQSGRMDVVVVQNEGEGNFSDGLYWYQNEGNGVFQQHLLDASYQAVHQIDIADMNNDGTQDIVVGEQEQADMGPNLNGPPGGRLAIFYNDGNGNFTQQVISNFGIQNQVVGDVDGNGYLDIFGANHGFYGGNKELQLWYNEGTGSSGNGPNLIQDPGFENQSHTSGAALSSPWFTQDPSGEQIDAENLGTAHSGSIEANFWQPNNTGNSGFSDIYQTVSVTPNTSYTLSGWFDDSDNSGFTGAEFGVRTGSGSVVTQTAIPPTGGVSASGYYQQVSLTFNSGNNTSLQVFAGYTPTQFSWLHVDDVLLTANGTTVQPPAAPTSLGATAGIGQVALTWTGSTGATSYNIYRGTSSGQESKIASGVSGTSYSDTTVSNGTTYFYVVTAVNNGGESGQSNEVSATPAAPTSNLIQNPGFETGSLSPWFVEGAPTAAGIDNLPAHSHSGTDNAYIFDNSGSSKSVDLAQTVNVAPNTTYTLSASIDANVNAANVTLGVKTTGGTVLASTAPVNGNDPGASTSGGSFYHLYTLTFNSGNNTSVVIFAGYKTPGTGAGSYINLDDVSLTPSAANLVQNAGFETGSLGPWRQEGSGASGVDTNSTHAHTGNDAAALWSVNGSADLAQTITVTPNTTYTLTAWIDASNTSNGLLGVKTTGGSVIASTPLTNTDPGPITHKQDYRMYTVTFNSGSNTSLVIFAGYSGSNSGFINLDDVSLTSGN